MSRRWLLVGALRVETLPVARRLQRPRPLGTRLVLGQTPGGVHVALLTCGVGPCKAEQRTRAALQRFDAQAVLSFGTAGALTDGLPRGSVRTIGRVLRDSAPSDEAIPLPGLSVATITTVHAPVWTPERRAALAAAGADLCDMEAAAVAIAAGDLPFSAIKIISDQAGGSPDRALTAAHRPNPARIARFKARALKLCDDVLADAIIAAIDRAG